MYSSQQEGALDEAVVEVARVQRGLPRCSIPSTRLLLVATKASYGFIISLLSCGSEEVCVGVIEVLLEAASLPQIGCQELVGFGDGREGGLGEVAQCGRVARG